MGYKLETAKSSSGMVYDQIHLIRLNAQQEHRDNVNEHAVFDVMVRYRTYGIMADGTVVYSNEGIKDVRLDDFLQLAINRQITGDPGYMQTFQALTELVWRVAAANEGTTPVQS